MMQKEKIWVWIGLLGVVTIFFLPWRYQVNDDILMTWLVSGNYTGTAEPYLIFMHPLWTHILSFLYTYSIGIPWYAIQTFLVLAVSAFFGINIVQEAVTNRTAKFLLTILILCITWHIAYFPQFTLVAGWATVTSLFYIHFVKGQNSRLFFAWGLFSVSAMIRLESAGLILLGYCIFAWGPGFKKHEIKIASIAGIILFSLVFSQKIWENQSEYQEFLSFNKARATVIDHPVFYEDWIGRKIEKGSQWFYFSEWFIEKSAINQEDLESKKIELDSRQFHFDELKNSKHRLIRVLQEESFKTSISLILVITVLLNINLFQGKTGLSILIWLMFFLLFNHFFHVKGRALFLFSLPLFLPLVQILGDKIKVRGTLLFSGILILLFCVHTLNFFKESRERKQYVTQFNSLVGKSNQLIKLEGFPLEFLSKEYLDGNTPNFLLDGWIARSPFQKRALEKNGYQDFKDIQEYLLVGIKKYKPFFFPDYMNSFGNHYELIETKETKDLILLRFKLKDSGD
jgi:hypothetical protein